MTLPKISIVTPSFNQVDYIEDTIKSILNQDYPNLEYVIVDGGSTDGSVDIIKKYQDKLHYFVSEKDDGHGHAINKGFAHTTGEIMAWLNSDDMYTPWAFRAVAEIFMKFPQIEWIVGINSVWNKNGMMTSAYPRYKNIYDFLAGDYGWIQQESVFWRRSLWDKSGAHINQNYKLMVDGELWTRFFLHADLYSVDCVLGGYRLHDTNRAQLHYQDCIDEMEVAIASMRGKCAPRILKNANHLILSKSIKKIPFIGSQLYRKSLFGRALKNARYHNVAWHNGEWIIRRKNFGA